MRSPRAWPSLSVPAVLFFLLGFAQVATTGQETAQRPRKPLEKVKMTVPAKSLTFFPYYFGKDKRIFEEEGIDIELIVIRPPIGIIALQAGELDYSAAGGLGMRAALKGAALRVLMFMQTRLSFSLVGQPGMTAQKIGTVGVSGIGSLAHYAALAVMKKLGRGGANDNAANNTTNTLSLIHK
jgi:ABC-type nitrate/sulfonate/bicarbonate transport system substrate-binding protein